MKIAKIVLASCVALTLTGSAAFAQQATSGTGMVTIVDRLNSTVAIRPAQDGTVGANNGGAAIEFKAKGISLEDVHAGDRVKYSATEADGGKTLTKIEKQ
jgi:Cu/Ag efflux protein CusF